MTGGGCRRGESGGGGGWLRCCLVMFAVVSALCVSGPALFWKFHILLLPHQFLLLLCSLQLRLSFLSLPSSLSLANLSIADCGSNDPDLKKEMEKEFVDLLTEESKLQEAAAAEHAQHMNGTFMEARRIASQYQRKAEKCNAATETCEEARERAEALLLKAKKLTSRWE